MEKYDVENHLFYDGYNLDNELLANPETINSLLETINKYIFQNKGKISLKPYFNGKVKKDGGVSGIILGDGFHFTCHTFSYKNTVFVDYFGNDFSKEKVSQILFDFFDTDEFDMGSKDVKGNFGKHIIVHPPSIALPDAKNVIRVILKEINMTPIMELLVNQYGKDSFDLLQPIAESHISFHKKNNKMVVDTFSCKYFDVDKFLEIMGNPKEYIEVNRGIKYRK